MPGGRIEIDVEPNLKDFPGKLQSGLKSASGIAATAGKAIGLAIAAGTGVAAVGLKSVLDIGIQYEKQLNTLQAVTQATGVQMAQVGNLAKQLGADMSLPATSAADAAAAMTELAKGGLTVEEAMTAAKGTLQLAAAAQIEAAQAAEIQSDALNQFGLEASQASHVADLLANTANAASGEITDMANALKFVGPVAKSIGENIDNVSTAIGVLAVQGIRGEQAGTSLRGMLASLSAPSKPAAEALKVLGINAFDTSGKFVGLRTITEQLAQAKGKLSDAEFAAAAATAFGNEGLTTATALAAAGGKAFGEMATAVTRSGGAAEVAAAKTKGLGGAWEGLKSQAETTGIEIFEAIDGPLEALVRSAANFVDEFGGQVAQGVETAVSAGELFGPRLADAISSRAAVVGAAVRDVLGPVGEGAVDVLNSAVNAAMGLWEDFTGVLRSAVDAAKPVAQGIKAVAQSASEAGGPVAAVAAGIGLAGDAARIAAGLLVPLGAAVGVIARGFSELPGPIQSAVVALGLVAAFRGPLASLGNTVRDSVTTPFRNLSETIRLQSALLTGSTQIASREVGKLGLAFSALEKHVPVIGRMADSYRGASESARTFVTTQSQLVQAASGISGQYTGVANALNRSEGALRGVAGAAAGTTAALGTGLKAAASGLVSVFGGPWGVALAAAAVGLSLLSSRQADAAARASEHASHVDGLAAALRESNGVVDQAVRSRQALALQSDKIGDSERIVADAARDAGISLDELTEATLGNGDALDSVRGKLEAIIKANTEYATSAGAAKAGRTNDIVSLNEQGQAAQDLLNEINGLAKGFAEAERKRKELDAAIANGTASMLDSTDSGRTLAGAMKILASNTADADSRARALKDALDALSGGTISLEAAQSRVQESLARIRDLFGENVDKTKGWGDALLNADGSINLTVENGRRLRDALADLTTHTADVASKTYDMAIAQGDSVPVAAGKASQAMANARQAFIDTAAQMGITADEAAVLADRAGLIPENVAMVVSSPGSDRTKIELALVKELADKVPADKPITVRSLSDEAKKKLEDLGFTVKTLPNGTVVITGNTGPAQAALNSFVNAPSPVKTIYFKYVPLNSPPSLSGNFMSYHGNLFQPFATGGIATAFANGGVAQKLKPMRGGFATMVPPNSWRVVGDRMDVPEAYIPINRSPRSIALLDETARLMGFALARRFANGGIAMSTAQTAGSGGSAPIINIDARGATREAVQEFKRSAIPQLTRMLKQQVGKNNR